MFPQRFIDYILTFYLIAHMLFDAVVYIGDGFSVVVSVTGSKGTMLYNWDSILPNRGFTNQTLPCMMASYIFLNHTY